MKRDLIEKLKAFDLSQNQAKVYAYLCEFKKAEVSAISEATNIYAQDIYKTVKELEAKGLVLKTRTQPLMIELIPVEKALGSMISLIESDSKDKLETLRKYCREISSESKKSLKNIGSKKSSNCTVIVFEKEAPESRVDLAFDNLKEEYDCVLVEGVDGYRRLGVEYGKIVFKRIAKKGVKIKILIIGRESNIARVEALKRSMPKSNYEIRSLAAREFIPCPSFALIDSRELWLRAASLGEGATILTDVKEMVEIAKNQFEALWTDPNVKIEA